MSKHQDYVQKTEALVEPILQKHQFELVDVEFVKEAGSWHLRVYIDKEGGITIDDLTLVNHELSDEMDKDDFIEESYILEVSSPGLLRPFKKPKDVMRNIGEDVENTFHITIDRSVNPNTESDGIEDVDELSFIDGYMLDVDKLIMDEIVVALPTKVLCKEDCKGLCSICGTNLNNHTCDCHKESLDPRMAAIQDIFRDFNQ